MKKSYQLLSLNDITDCRGSLVSLETFKNVPFEIKRVYYLYNLKENERRGFHAHKQLEQLLICIHGKCKIKVNDGNFSEEVILNTQNQALYLNNNVWREMYDFEDECVIIVLASEYYDESDYIRDYNDFLQYIEVRNSETKKIKN